MLNWRIVEPTNGGTRFTYGLEVNSKGVMRLLDGLLQRVLQRQIGGDVERLKDLME